MDDRDGGTTAWPVSQARQLAGGERADSSWTCKGYGVDGWVEGGKKLPPLLRKRAAASSQQLKTVRREIDDGLKKRADRQESKYNLRMYFLFFVFERKLFRLSKNHRNKLDWGGSEQKTEFFYGGRGEGWWWWCGGGGRQGNADEKKDAGIGLGLEAFDKNNVCGLWFRGVAPNAADSTGWAAVFTMLLLILRAVTVI